MPSGKSVTLLFGVLAILLSSFFQTNENRALAAKPPAPYVVVLDPGHGGSDTGAIGRLGKKKISEKEIALGIAIRTAKLLEDETYWKALGRPIKVILTRKKDQHVSLEARSHLAKESGAQLFVSIHSNSDPSKRASGLETYFLNNTDDESAKKLEQIENKSSKKYANADPASLLIRSVAADAVVENSKQAADLIHGSIANQLRQEDVKFHDRGVRQAMLYVLLDSQVPAVLLEAFFLSSKSDLALISEGGNRQIIAEGLARGILRYLALQ